MRKPKILVVEDNALTQRTLAALFSQLQCDVVGIINGLEVLPYLKKNSVDVLVLDLDLPGMTGDEIYTRLFNIPDFRSIIVVPYTAHADKRAEHVFPADIIDKMGGSFFTVYRSGDSPDVNRQLVETIAARLQTAGKSLPIEMERYLGWKE